MELRSLLESMVEHNATDLFISAAAPPYMQIEGEFRATGTERLTSIQARALTYSILTKDQVQEFELTNELNTSFRIEGIGRFRINVFRQMGEVAMVARHIRARIPSLEELNLPPLFKELSLYDRGLILVVGGTGTGKSTTLASMLDYRNSTKTGHILTIEEPVEFVHEHKKSLVNQREVGVDTESYEIALKNAMREAPNVIMIGEIRDTSTMKKAIAYAETGCLCLSTLHANSASDAVDRIVNFFPHEAYRQLYNDLASHLVAVISLRLPVGSDGKRVAAVEVMLNTPYISGLIYEGQIGKLKEALEKEKGEGCQTFDSALFSLVQQGKISKSEALNHADSRNNLALRFRLEGTAEEVDEDVLKEVAFSRAVSFESFNTYRVAVTALRGSKPVRMQNIEDGVQNVLIAKGLSVTDESPDLEVRYYLTGPDSETPGTARSELDRQVQRFGVLCLSFVDLASQKTIWRVKTPNNRITNTTPQNEVNKVMEKLLTDFPPGVV
ncbi:MAG: type IV pili twitching motility protein PilT [Gammaproteobacteria bacterium]|nr:MAG: type IV pili twitching motility protein PilT [Pseudomonadota bacterium]PIE38622.1 MAG: type IV pili twitching motility protein PilT [Gammaproteobacteria bacterium]